MHSSIKSQRSVRIVALIVFCVVAIFAPDPSASLGAVDSRLLSAKHANPLDRRLATGQCAVPISDEDFEGPDALNGWTDGILETSNQANFTKFLGRYSVNTTAPYKTYNVPVISDATIVELDFYELDSWDGVDEKISIFIDDEEVDLEEFRWDRTDDSSAGVSAIGIEWTTSKLTDPQHLGFSSLWYDQMHRVSLRIPKATGLYDDGQIVVKMVVSLDQASYDESAGWTTSKYPMK